MKDRIILHADLDAFFASVEVLDHPELAGRPVIVGGNANRGVVATASYEARAFGVHSGMPMVRARRACPQAVVLPPRMDRYDSISHQVMSVFRSITPLVEPISVDEAFLDITGSIRRCGAPAVIAERIRECVRSECGIAVSIGGGPSKVVSKMATEHAKPDGVYVVERAEQQAFLDRHLVGDVPGIGPKTAEVLKRFGLTTVLEVRHFDEDLLVKALGNHRARELIAMCNGNDVRVIEPVRERKSVGHEETFLRDVPRGPRAEYELFRVLHESVRRARLTGSVARTVHLKIRDTHFHTITRSTTIAEPTMLPQAWWPHVQRLFRAAPDSMQAIRLFGVSFSQLSHEQVSLFQTEQLAGAAEVQHAIDHVRAKFGATAIGVARLVGSKTRTRNDLYGPTEERWPRSP